MKKFLTGIKPTGRLHFGNYFSVVKQIKELADSNEGEVYLFIADLHSLTSEEMQNAKLLKENSRNLVLDLVSFGIDTDKVKIYRQSDFPEITELAWIFNCLSTLPYAKRFHAYKEKGDEDKTNLGLLSYPLLMASDILLPGGTHVPIGKDQNQHLEVARDMARKFNSTFSEYFKEPEGITETEEDFPGVDGRKMSKSYGNAIYLPHSEKELREQVSSIVTDSKDIKEVKEDNLLIRIYSYFSDDKKPIEDLKSGSIGYKEFKDILSETIINQFKESMEKRNELENNPDFEEEVYSKNRDELKELFSTRLKEIKNIVGLL